MYFLFVIYCWACSLPLRVIYLPGETPSEQTKFSFSNGYQLDTVAGLEIGHASISSFSSRCRPVQALCMLPRLLWAHMCIHPVELEGLVPWSSWVNYSQNLQRQVKRVLWHHFLWLHVPVTLGGTVKSNNKSNCFHSRWTSVKHNFSISKHVLLRAHWTSGSYMHFVSSWNQIILQKIVSSDKILCL